MGYKSIDEDLEILQDAENFTIEFIQRHRNIKKSNGVNIRDTDFERKLDDYFLNKYTGGLNTQLIIKHLVKNNIIEIIPSHAAHSGQKSMMYIYGEGPTSSQNLSTCDLIALHHKTTKNDPNRLTTDFIQKTVGRECMDDKFRKRKTSTSKSKRKVVKKCKCKK